jgi:hypothetical protein
MLYNAGYENKLLSLATQEYLVSNPGSWELASDWWSSLTYYGLEPYEIIFFLREKRSNDSHFVPILYLRKIKTETSLSRLSLGRIERVNLCKIIVTIFHIFIGIVQSYILSVGIGIFPVLQYN